MIQIWGAQTGVKIPNSSQRVGYHGTMVSFTSNEERVVSGGSDEEKNVMVWHATTGVPLLKRNCKHTAIICAMAISPVAQRIALGSFKSVTRRLEFEIRRVHYGFPTIWHNYILP